MPPPCGGAGGPCFHRNCLELARAARPGTCPHCNGALSLLPDELGRLGRMLQARARCRFWVQKPVFIAVREHGVMPTEEALAALAALSHEVLRCLGAQEGRLLKEEEDGRWAWRSVDAAAGTLTSLPEIVDK